MHMSSGACCTQITRADCLRSLKRPEINWASDSQLTQPIYFSTDSEGTDTSPVFLVDAGWFFAGTASFEKKKMFFLVQKHDKN